MSESLLWVEKYRRELLEDCILPESIKKTLRDVVSQNKIPNMMFTGTSGIGKKQLLLVRFATRHKRTILSSMVLMKVE